MHTNSRSRDSTILRLKGSLLLLILFALSGCANLFIEPYGFVAADSEPANPDREEISIPQNAPSISQGYKPEPASGGHAVQDSYHEGIDIIDKAGTPVLAPAAGVVTSSYFEPFYGNRLILSHGKDGSGLFLKSKYFHLRKRLVKAGETVRRGQQIGTLGRSGLLSGGFPHLHFEIRGSSDPDPYRSEPLHPHKFWVDGSGVITCFDRTRKYPENIFRTTYPVPCRGLDWR